MYCLIALEVRILRQVSLDCSPSGCFLSLPSPIVLLLSLEETLQHCLPHLLEAGTKKCRHVDTSSNFETNSAVEVSSYHKSLTLTLHLLLPHLKVPCNCTMPTSIIQDTLLVVRLSDYQTNSISNLKFSLSGNMTSSKFFDIKIETYLKVIILTNRLVN